MNSKNKQRSYMVDESVMIFFLLCSSLLLICAETDTMRLGDWIVAENDTLVSAGGKFELGFFSPKEFSSSPSADIRRYVGIWYHNLHRRIVVWVANRKYPLLVNSSVVFGITEDGNLQIRDNRTGASYWSTDLKKSSSSSANRSVTLMDTGNLVLRGSINDQWATSSLWESFRDASDTFLPGMKMDENITLTSWKSEDDPRIGEFHFKLENGSYVVFKNKSVLYWKSGDAGKFFGSAKMSETVVNLLSNFTKNITSRRRNLENDYFLERFVIKPNGTIQYLNWDKENSDWSVKWWAPRDNCSVFNACGDFGICTVSDNEFTCKCIPGFMPKNPKRWKSGHFLGGCKRGKALCGEKTTFLSLKMIKVGYPKSEGLPVNNEAECWKKCQDNCHCQAYSLQPTPRRGNTALCWIWQESLNDLQEDYAQGDLELFVQVVLSDLEPTGRDCRPCGTTVIPYPLSTGYDCGDPLYFSFQCNNTNGRVSFNASGGEYQVISINPNSQKFIIQVHEDKVIHDCMPKIYRTKPQLDQSVFNATDWCYDKGEKGKIEVQWKIPQEPTCTLKEDCKEWPSSTCSKAKSDGKKRCFCNSNFNWDGVKLNCTGKQGRDLKQSEEKPYKEKAPSPLVILLSTISSVTILACIVLSFVMWQRKMAERKEKRKLSEQRNRALRPLDTERQINDLIDSSEFKGDGEKGIDLPFFDLESILAATDYFSDENKLGQGGYGPVYKGKFPGGQDIAIKRLSSVSGQGLQEFKNEVILIAKLQHRNLVRLRGYCMEKDEKILLYEYMPNKSLDTFIFDDTKRALLDWVLRFDIIMGIARGLLYLHQDSRLRIIHRDLKTSNILLDQFMNPKISDFGLARMVGGKQTEANTSRVVGTYGYMPPEYALEGVFSVKSDVFSFGVVLLEIVSGKRNTRLVQSDQPLTLQGYAWRLWTENKVLDLMDQTLKESCKEDQFIKCVNVGLLCVQEDACDRPNMSNIVTMLDSESATLPSPKQPAFALRRGSSTGTASSSSKPTANIEITFSLEEGR